MLSLAGNMWEGFLNFLKKVARGNAVQIHPPKVLVYIDNLFVE